MGFEHQTGIAEDNAYTIMRGGRARWKIENETFNTLKNQGYHFKHNFGLGKKHLAEAFYNAHDVSLSCRSNTTTLLSFISSSINQIKI